MLNFKKALNLKIVSIIMALSFISISTLYSYSVSKDSLRTSVGQSKTYDRITYVIKTYRGNEAIIDRNISAAHEAKRVRSFSEWNAEDTGEIETVHNFLRANGLGETISIFARLQQTAPVEVEGWDRGGLWLVEPKEGMPIPLEHVSDRGGIHIGNFPGIDLAKAYSHAIGAYIGLDHNTNQAFEDAFIRWQREGKTIPESLREEFLKGANARKKDNLLLTHLSKKEPHVYRRDYTLPMTRRYLFRLGGTAAALFGAASVVAPGVLAQEVVRYSDASNLNRMPAASLRAGQSVAGENPNVASLLYRFGYPIENSLGLGRPRISDESNELFKKIIESYGKKYEEIKKESQEKYEEKLLSLLKDLRLSLKDKGYLDHLHIFLKLLVSNLDPEEDIFKVIESSNEIPEETRKRMMMELTFCTSKAQEANYLLRLIGVNKVRSLIAPGHSTIAISFGNNRYLIADFVMNIFMIIDLPSKFDKENGHWFLKDSVKLTPQDLKRLKQQQKSGSLPRLTDDKTLNLFYSSIYIVFEDLLVNPDAETQHMQGSTLAIRIKRGLTYQELGDFYKDIKAKDPSYLSPSEYFYTKAINEYITAIRIDNKCAEAHENLGLLLNRLGRTREAISELIYSISLNNRKASAHLNLGGIYADMHQWEKAAEEHRKAVELDPNSGIAYANLGDAYVNLGKYEDALGIYIKGIALMPEDPSLHFGLGLVYYNLKRYNEALKEFEKAMEIDPNVWATPYHIGLTYYQLGDLKKAGKFFDAAIKINENFYEAYLYRGWIYYKTGDSNKAINAWAEAYLIKKSLKLNIKDLPPEIENLPADVADAVKKLVDSTNLTAKRKTSSVLPCLFGLGPARDIARQAI